MKQKFLFGLVCAMSFAMLTACGSADTATDTTDTEAAADSEESTDSAADSEESTDSADSQDSADPQDSSEVSLKTYEGDGWSVEYDPAQLTANEGDDGSVTFAFSSADFTTAGSDYSIISRIEDTDYETVLADKQAEYGAEDAEILEANYGENSIPSYSFTKTFDASEGSELQINVSCTAIPVDSDVILIDNYITLEPNEDDQMTVDSAFESMLGSISVK